MPNTNAQTIHQMGQAINSVVRQTTGRDAVGNNKHHTYYNDQWRKQYLYQCRGY